MDSASLGLLMATITFTAQPNHHVSHMQAVFETESHLQLSRFVRRIWGGFDQPTDSSGSSHMCPTGYVEKRYNHPKLLLDG